MRPETRRYCRGEIFRWGGSVILLFHHRERHAHLRRLKIGLNGPKNRGHLFHVWDEAADALSKEGAPFIKGSTFKVYDVRFREGRPDQSMFVMPEGAQRDTTFDN